MTITATPDTYSSLQYDLIYTVEDAAKTSDSVTYPNYKFIGDVYVGATLVARIKKVPDPTTGIGIFNIGQTVRNYITTVFNPTTALESQELGLGVFNLVVTMKFGEEYSFTPTYDIVSDTARTYFNHYNKRLLGQTSALTAFIDSVASNRPAIGKLFYSSEYYFVPYFPTSTGAVSVTVTPTGGGTPLITSLTPATALAMQVLNIAPATFNAIASGTINAATTSYTVQIGSETFTFKIICEAIYTPYAIHFLNQYNGFETFIFQKVSRLTYDTQRKDFGKLPYTVDSGGLVTYKNSNGVYNESRSVYAETFKEKLELNSDLITDAEYRWLADLILSPMVYVEDSGYFFPVVLTGSTYEFKKVVNDDLTGLTVNIEYGTTLNSQFR